LKFPGADQKLCLKAIRLILHLIMRLTVDNAAIESFRNEIYRYFEKSGRRLPWRRAFTPYKILISEIMLQQTQVERVIDKYERFVKAFPDFHSLRRASLAEVYSLWQGLGYNRRALALKEIARTVIEEYDGRLPDTVERLSLLPGIGPATASSICAFAFSKPTVFIETNIRTVFIYHFFRRRRTVADAEIIAIAEKALDRNNPRKWYSALMDYGTMLKKKHPGLLKKSAHYKKQSPFKGSRRQLRGKILRMLLDRPRQTEMSLFKKMASDNRETLHEIIMELIREGFVKKKKGWISICDIRYDIAVRPQ
jgi:A/G-specific adenine glycosylase